MPTRKAVLEAIAGGLRARGFVPVLFDFERPATRDFTETVMTPASGSAHARWRSEKGA